MARTTTMKMNVQMLSTGKYGQLRHPDYDANYADWRKYRLTMEGGEDFVEEYLTKYPNRETGSDYQARLDLTPCSAHAKAAVKEVGNNIYARMRDVVRAGGPEDYRTAAEGKYEGVDRSGSSMNSFIGRNVILELLSLSKVGVYIDKDSVRTASRRDVLSRQPYLYIYTAEQILNWTYDSSQRLTSVLLQDNIYEYDEETGFPTAPKVQYRYLRLTPTGVEVKIYDENDDLILSTTLNLPRIPFVIFEISESLLRDIADFQIALTNMESADIDFIIKANFPFYTEQRMPSEADYMRPASTDTSIEGTASAAGIARKEEVTVGVTKGRAYAPQMDRPGFIHPSPEPLKASMEKQEATKATIRQLLNLTISNIQPTRQASDTRKMDQEGLISGMSAIGSTLEYGEREIAKIWSLYQGTNEIADVHYPKDYNTKSDTERLNEAKEYRELLGKISSITYQREIAKIIAYIMLSGKVSYDTLSMIYDEIDAAPVVDIDPTNLLEDIREGLLTRELGSKARLYPTGEVEKAAKEHADRLTRIAIAQSQGAGASATQAQGVEDLDGDFKSSTKNEE